jgi:hypothetical protein
VVLSRRGKSLSKAAALAEGGGVFIRNGMGWRFIEGEQERGKR